MSAPRRLRRLAVAASCATALALGAAAPATAQTGTTTTAPGTTAPSTGGSPTTATTPEVTADQLDRGAVVAPADRIELASSLAEASEASGVCFGYELRLSAPTGSSIEVVSSLGPDRAPTVADCPKGAVVASIGISYTSESSESEDSASVSVLSTVPGLPSSTVRRRLDDLGVIDKGALLGDEDDLAVRNLVAALPLTLDAAVPAGQPAAATTAPNGDRLTGSPGSDWVRAHLVTVLVSGVIFLVALVAALAGWHARRQLRRPQDPSSSRTDPDTQSR